ncbi:PspC domain-containing protein [Actinomycetospora cinnamomea]|uniref:Phage shock protein C (PspC) family protein n=1 Tax=Actinomycetospora cinnamomea TaxID=663609 RepID=A0A2U1F292_9PSEU|nr:PspC domain-containing protein [Actinomycetospora cinnamomea]PVZ06297.1 phage shock protein C (PspC) family protein [Actinomycetospora cinnamomea]
MDDPRPPAVDAPGPDDVRTEQGGAAPRAAGPSRLVRSRRDRIVGGVCGGLGRYLGVDPVLVRIVTVALMLSVGVGVLAYVVAWIVIPEADEDEPPVTAAPTDRHRVTVVAGAALVALGVLLLVRAVIPWFDGAVFWPLVVIGVGVLVVVSSRR